MKMVLATRNSHKIREILDILKDLNGIEFITLDQFANVPEVEEDGETLYQNAMIKTQHAAGLTGRLSLGEDTGLEIDALVGKPGVRSARFAGERATYEANVEKVLRLLRDIPAGERTARFRSVVVIMKPGEGPHVFEGICEGKIIDKRKGEGGFGYDPIFQPEGYEKT
ncbi:non-canonical purine NTP pyrophosphatase, partial [bacterium]|nr:non-canonical purine NTP pyrophosphatase [bacterium]